MYTKALTWLQFKLSAVKVFDPLDNSTDTQPKEQDEIKKFVNLQFITAAES